MSYFLASGNPECIPVGARQFSIRKGSIGSCSPSQRNRFPAIATRLGILRSTTAQQEPAGQVLTGDGVKGYSEAGRLDYLIVE